MATETSGASPSLVDAASQYVKQYMSNYDGSHDFNHIQRVLGLARHIASQSPELPGVDPQVVVLGALLHDVGDKKYLKPGEDASTMVSKLLISLGADEKLAKKVQEVCLGVSYSSEVKDPARVQRLIQEYPELAIVQDADRLDAVGAIGIGRCFTFGGARTQRPMDETADHFEDKLFKLEGMMKTEVGRRLARERTERLRLFRLWWDEESAFATNPAISS